MAIESYGQGETADTIQHCDEDPSILLRFLDGFIDFGELRNQDEAMRDAILTNQTVIETLQQASLVALELSRYDEAGGNGRSRPAAGA